MRIFLSGLAALAVGCGQKPVAANDDPAAPTELEAGAAPPPTADSGNVAPDALPAGFPKPSANYAGVYQFGDGDAASEIMIAASGSRQRLTFPPGAGLGGGHNSWSQIIVTETVAGKMTRWAEGAGAPKIVTEMSKSDIGAAAGALGVDAAAAARGKRTGADKIAGENCAVWEFAPAAEGEAPTEVCVTGDGIVLRAASGGKTQMLAKSIERGAQDPALFAPPAGYEVVDMGECMRLGAEMMAAAREGKTPDMAKMEKCRALGEKMGGIDSGE